MGLTITENNVKTAAAILEILGKNKCSVADAGDILSFCGRVIQNRATVPDYVAKDGGDLDIVIRGFGEGDEAFLFGETETTAEKTAASGSDDIVPYVCVAYMTERPDGKVNLYKFPKVKFMPQGEDSQQREGTKISYTTASLKGTYSPLLSTHSDCYKCRGVDPSTQADLISNWFAEADYYTADVT